MFKDSATLSLPSMKLFSLLKSPKTTAFSDNAFSGHIVSDFFVRVMQKTLSFTLTILMKRFDNISGEIFRKWVPFTDTFSFNYLESVCCPPVSFYAP